jgi:hypothetical protein
MRLFSKSPAMKVTAAVALLGALAAVGVALATPPLPAPTISASPASPTNQTSASFTYTHSQAITKFQCALDGSSFSDCGTTRPSTKSYPGPLSQGSHTFQVRAVSGSQTSSATSYAWTIDTAAPSVSSINRVGASPTNGSSVQWTVTFSEGVTSVDPGDFALASGGLGGSPAITGVSGSGSSYTVTASTGTGSGTLGLNLVDNDTIKDAASNKLGGTGNGNGNFTGQAFSLDRGAPSVVSINRVGTSPTNAASVQWSVVFSESVAGVNSGDFQLANGGLGSPSIASVSGSGSTYTVTANTGSGSGTLGLNLVDDDSIADSVGNKLGGTGAGDGNFTGQVFTVDKTPPALTSINRTGSSPTNASSVQWSVVFSESVTGVDSGDFTLVKTGLGGTPAVTGVSGSGTTYTVTASTGSGSGTLGLNLTDNDSVVDALGNKLGGSGSGNGNFTGQVYAVDRSAPTVSSINRSGPSPTNASSVQWTVVFGESVTGVDASDFSLPHSGIAGSPAISSVGGSGATNAVTASTGSGSGTLGLNLVDNDTIADAAGNKLGGAGSGNGNFSGQAFAIDRQAPDPPDINLAPLPYPPFGWSSPSAAFYFDDDSSDVASYQCKLDAGAFVACSSPKSYSGLAEGQHTFRVKAVDTAGNVSAEATWTFFTDTVAPTKPVFTQTPPDPSATATSTFAWTSSDPSPGSGVAGYLCSKENGNWFPCSSPYTYAVQTTSNGQHQFAVVAVDWAGNISQAADYKWKVAAGTGQMFSIAGNANGLLYPGIWRYVALTITNPNSVPIYVTSITTSVTNDPNGCSNSTNIELQQSPAAPTSNEMLVPANVTNWPVPQPFQPQIRLRDLLSTNQDNCKSQTFSLSYTGSAHS